MTEAGKPEPESARRLACKPIKERGGDHAGVDGDCKRGGGTTNPLSLKPGSHEPILAERELGSGVRGFRLNRIGLVGLPLVADCEHFDSEFSLFDWARRRAPALRFTTFQLRRQSRELRTDPRERCGPVAGSRLPVELHRRVPRRVVPPEQPAPVGIRRQQRPGALAEGPAQMRHACVDADDNVEQLNHRRGVGEVVELRPKRTNLRMRRQHRGIGRADFLLQTDELPSAGKVGQELREPDASVAVALMVRAPAPHDSGTAALP